MVTTRLGRALLALVLLCVGAGTSCRPGPNGNEESVDEPVESYHPKQPIVLKFAEGLSVSYEDGAFSVAPAEGRESPLGAEEIADALAKLNRRIAGETVHPMFEDEARGLMPEGKPVLGRDLRLYFVISIREGTPRAETDALVSALADNPLVETCYVGPIPVPAGAPPGGAPPGGVPGR